MPEEIQITPPRKNKRLRFYRIMMVPVVLCIVMSVYLYGARALMLVSVSVFSALISDFFGSLLTKQKLRFSDCSDFYLGSLLALMLPASSPWWLPAAGAAFGVLFIKIPFGGAKYAPFSVTAAAYSFLCICFGNLVFAYPALNAGSKAYAYNSEFFVQGTSLAKLCSGGNTPIVTAVELINSFVGSIPGPMGVTSAALLAGALIYLLIRRSKCFVNSFAFLLACFIGSVITVFADSGNILTENSMRVVCLKLFSGLTLCIAVFLISEEPVSPKKISHRFFYGALAGVLYVIINRFSVYEEAGCFAVLLTNAAMPFVQKYIFRSGESRKKAEQEVIPSE